MHAWSRSEKEEKEEEVVFPGADFLSVVDITQVALPSSCWKVTGSSSFNVCILRVGGVDNQQSTSKALINVA